MATEKLTELNPRWVSHGGKSVHNEDGSPIPERKGIALSFDCPGGCGLRAFVAFANPLDGGPPLEDIGSHWQRTGDTFETLTLTPSILERTPGGCGWHGFITNGEVVVA